MTRSAFAHDAVVEDLVGDERAPGGAVTVALCGSWDHEPPCPLAPHHTETQRYGDELRLRILFATDTRHEAEVRTVIRRALASGSQRGPDGTTSTWRLVEEGASDVRPGEAEHAARLSSS